MRAGSVQFEFATATRIVFGSGSAAQLPDIARSFGRRALLVTGTDPGRAAARAGGLEHQVFPVSGEPTVDLVRAGVAAAREHGCDVVIGFGGGSAIDGGKAIAALAANPGDALDYLEVVGKGRPLDNAPLPFLAVPTTAGTGAEVTRNAVLESPKHRVKASLRSPLMLPKLAVIDPDLTLGLPRDITASTGMDALTQLIEPYVSIRRNVFTDLFSRDGIQTASFALPRVWENGGDREARERMSFCALLGGLSLANAGLGAVHGFAAPIGGMFDAPHGAVCAALLPHVMAANIAALRARDPRGGALNRYQGIGVMVNNDGYATAEDGAKWALELCRRLEIPPLRRYGVSEEHIPDIAAKAAAASSMKANPVALTPEELTEILRRAI